MRFKATGRSCFTDKHRAGFTLAEVLAAMVFMAIVIPTAVHGLRVANLAGQLGIRKSTAARIADRVLNELLITRQWQTGAQSGLVNEGAIPYRWLVRNQPWTELSTLRQLTVQVTFPVQGRDYEVRLSTIVDPTSQ